jgi:putative PIG3 family NAD(P)H quinone oxidoreductase
MKAIVYRGAGDASVIQGAEVPAPELKPGQVRIAVRASGVNRADLSQRRGHYPPPPGESDIPGLEAAGEVLETGPGARIFSRGDRVMALLAGGGYAQEVCVDERLVLALPPTLSFELGAAIPEAFITAHHNLVHLGGVAAGKSALIHAGASGVGTAAIQIVRFVKAAAFATAGTPEKAALCEKLGASAIEYKKADFAGVVLERTEGRGVDAILDPVGASNLEADLRCLTTSGCVVFIGTMGGKDAQLDLGALMRRRARLIGSTLRALPLEEKAAAVARMRAQLLDALAGGTLAPVIDRVFPAGEARQAQERMEANLNAGKIVLSWR